MGRGASFGACGARINFSFFFIVCVALLMKTIETHQLAVARCRQQIHSNKNNNDNYNGNDSDSDSDANIKQNGTGNGNGNSSD